MRIRLRDCFEKLSLGSDSSLLFEEHSVAVVYFRTGYTPDAYPDSKAWDARLMMERSTAIKCPWIGLQLANTKKFQQVLSKRDIIEHYFSKEDADIILEVFAKLWGLENNDAETLALIDDAVNFPNKYVLKPQLEGGAGNYFDDALRRQLIELQPNERSAYILMERITPLVVKNYMIRPFQTPLLTDVVSELGIYGSLIGYGELGNKNLASLEIKFNKANGCILRTKSKGTNEGGIAIGASVVDTPCLF